MIPDIKKLKGIKAKGIYNISETMLRCPKEGAVKEMIRISKAMHAKDYDRRTSCSLYIITIKNKPQERSCKDHPTIRLITHA